MECAQCISKKKGGSCQKELCVLLLNVKNFPKAVFGECANYIAKRSCCLLEALYNCVHKDIVKHKNPECCGNVMLLAPDFMNLEFQNIICKIGIMI